jgi:hypothetical protein
VSIGLETQSGRWSEAASTDSELRTRRAPAESMAIRALNNFDDGFTAREQLPRRFNASIRDHRTQGKRWTSLVIDGHTVGDHLTDNAYGDDGYRFHDVFHLAHGAVLGWSPCLRRMLKVKRKSDATMDEVEDGARAIVLEETIVALIFEYCSSRAWQPDLSGSDDLIGTVQRLTSHLECAACAPDAWRQAIQDGADAWRTLRRTGFVSMTGDLGRRRLISG